MRYGKTLSSLIVALPLACGSPETQAVDAKFRATVEGDGVAEGSVASVDVYWLGEGSVEVRFDDADGVIPGPDELKGVVLQEGNAVLTEGMLEVEKGGTKHLIRLEGRIGPDAIDVRLTDTPPEGAAVSVRLRGEARPLDDAEALDGEYLVRREIYPLRCPGDAPKAPFGGRNLVIDVLPTADRARFVIDGNLAFTAPLEGSAVGWTGTLRTIDGYGYEGTVSGTLDAGGLALTIDLAAENFGPGCVDRATFTGSKRLPDEAVIDGVYRADYVWRDECFDEAGRFSAPVELLTQADGQVDFLERELGSWTRFSMTAGEPFSGDFIDIFGSGAVIAYDGVIDPPDLSYTAVYTFPFSEGPCDLTLDVTAYKRYFFPPDAE